MQRNNLNDNLSLLQRSFFSLELVTLLPLTCHTKFWHIAVKITHTNYTLGGIHSNKLQPLFFRLSAYFNFVPSCYTNKCLLVTFITLLPFLLIISLIGHVWRLADWLAGSWQRCMCACKHNLALCRAAVV